MSEMIELGVFERLVLNGLFERQKFMVRQGQVPEPPTRLQDYRIIRDLRMSLSFTEEDQKFFEFSEKGDRLTWNIEKELIPGAKKEFKLGEGTRGRKLVVDLLNWHEEQGLVNDENIALFELFMPEKFSESPQ